MNTNDGCDLNQENLELERQRYQFEKEKFREELRTERLKIVATALSIIIPVIIAGWTINSNLELQANQAKYDFSLKAADIVMSAETPAGIEVRAKALKNLFPNYFDEKFLANFNASEYSANESVIIKERKDKLLQILVENDRLSSKELIEWWKKLYPEDTWVNETKPSIIPREAEHLYRG